MSFESGRGPAEGPIRIWDVARGKKVRELGKGYYLLSCFSPDGAVLAAADRHSDLSLWAVSSGRKLRSWKAHELMTRFIAFAGDGKTIITGGDRAKGDPDVRLWETATGKRVAEIRGLANTFYTQRLSPDGKLLAAIALEEVRARGGMGVQLMPQARINLWDIASGKKVRELTVAGKETASRQQGFRTLAFRAGPETRGPLRLGDKRWRSCAR